MTSDRTIGTTAKMSAYLKYRNSIVNINLMKTDGEEV